MTMKNLALELINVMGLTGEMNIQFAEDRPADVPRLWVNPAKFLALTNFGRGKDFSEGLQETVAYYKRLAIERNLNSEIKLENWKE
jgi:UDP-glucose 4-epimerase